MSKLTDLELHSIYSKAFSEKSAEGIVTAGVAALRVIESAATEPLLQRIAELEQRNSDLDEDVQRFKKHALNEKAARLELEHQLEEARSQELEEAANGADALAKKWWARHCETNRHMETTREAHEDFCQLGRAIRALKGAKE